MPGLLSYLADVLPSTSRVNFDHATGKYNVYFARTAPDGAAINQGRLNRTRGIVEYTAPGFEHAPVIALTREEAKSLHDRLGVHFPGNIREDTDKLRKELKDAQTALAEAQQSQTDAASVNTRLKNEAGQHKNELRTTQARLDQLTELYNGLLDRLSTP
ncbi:hypothetical protein [Streptomyces sp. NPDC091027]|uniref:hypothetical protein n=1 Tax=Streptomyces sp. NPDC091027 TaxID=3365971 RepID=UPI0038241EC8